MATASRGFRVEPIRAFAVRHRLRWLETLVQKRRDVLPSYVPQRAGWAIAGRRLLLVTTVVLVAAFYGLASAILPPTLLAMIAAPYGLLALLVIWALPNAKTAPTELLVRLFLLYLVIQLLWPVYLAFETSGLPRMAPRRVVGTIQALILLICLSMSRPFWSQMATLLKDTRPVSTFFIVFFIGQFLSTLFSASPLAAIGPWIGGTLVNTPMFFITLWILGTRTRSIDWWVGWLLFCVGVMMVIGFVEFRAQHILWANSIPSFLRVDENMLEVILTPNFRGHYRVVTTFSSPLVWGELTALAMPFVLHRIANAKTTQIRLFWIAFDLALVVSAYLSGARLAMVGGISAHVLYLFFWAIRRWRNDRGSLLGIATTMMYPAFVLVLLLAVAFVPAVHNRVLGGGTAQASNYARQEQFRLAVPAVAKRPIFGWGPGYGAQAVGWHNEAGFLSIDSAFLMTAADNGLVGLISYFGGVVLMMVMLALRGFRSRTEGMPMEFALVSVYAVFLLSRSVLSQRDNDNLYWMLFGIGAALLYLNRDLRAPHKTRAGAAA
ncbi:O-antigen ligase family protein [Sphingomonas sp. TDK1]|uniref:O-antigen ligase family protein n=1 Tax=Sphingomonas sp. TDK1 TaxID=453247 RepID=UPI0007DA0372|nr:O-antigen ligase family protein [Sphingomonas sp. TDK1]OAN66841.1 hypothetical protein A7X12_09465 [Sphingomonas sp. TDK1]